LVPVRATATRKTLKGGGARWYAVYWGADGRERTEGGFVRKKDAERLAYRREQGVGGGKFADPARRKITFRRYVEDYYWPMSQQDPAFQGVD
jgi:hypothetical protein